ncbi:MAG: DUF4234 domain-containing protein [Lachnospiraceae bacterium]|nr:DUF4234 domain-containing protein [Lachnospiraceae bacterium]
MVKKRNLVLYIILSLITGGIFMLYWIYSLTTDTNTISGETDDTSGGMVILFTIITCGIYGLYWAYKRGGKIDKAKTNRGESASNKGILYLILYFFAGIISIALIQNEVNKFAE